MRFLHACTQVGMVFSMWGVCARYIYQFLVSVLCWLSKNNLDAFLFSPVFWNILHSNESSLLKLVKNSLVKPSAPDAFMGAWYFKNLKNFPWLCLSFCLFFFSCFVSFFLEQQEERSRKK